MTAERTVETLHDIAPDAIPFDRLVTMQAPVLLKGVVRDWPAVRAGLRSDAAADAYLRGFDQGAPVVGYTGPPEIAGRFHYDADLAGFNFTAARTTLGTFLDRLAAHRDDPAPPSLYIGSTDLDACLPGFRVANDLALPPSITERAAPLASIWIGNRTIATTHWDASHNIACCVAGHRRFTLFPPDQVANLYPGPLAPTPAGQVVSMVDLRAPDLDLYPRFADALATAQVADLEPGDLLLYPALWWHDVEAHDRFNILVNYWWNMAPGFMDMPMNALLLGLLSLRDRPDPEKRAWRALFDYYVFGPADRPRAHLPESAHGDLAPLDPSRARRLRALLLNRLNR